MNIEEMSDNAELLRYNQALAAGTPEPPIERHMPDWYLEYGEEIEKLKHNLRNEYYSNKESDKKNPWKPAGKAIMNEQGINMLIGFLTNTAFAKNLALTNFPTYNTALERSLDICLSVNTWLHKHYSLGDIEMDINDISYVNDMIRSISIATCLRAFGEGERRRVQNTNRTQTTLVGDAGGMMQQPQTGFLGGLLGGFQQR